MQLKSLKNQPLRCGGVSGRRNSSAHSPPVLFPVGGRKGTVSVLRPLERVERERISCEYQVKSIDVIGYKIKRRGGGREICRAVLFFSIDVGATVGG
jgi:hypothetical protein